MMSAGPGAFILKMDVQEVTEGVQIFTHVYIVVKPLNFNTGIDGAHVFRMLLIDHAFSHCAVHACWNTSSQRILHSIRVPEKGISSDPQHLRDWWCVDQSCERH